MQFLTMRTKALWHIGMPSASHWDPGRVKVFIYKFKWELTLHSDIVLFLEQLISLRFIMVFIVIMVVMIGVPCRHTINNIVNGDYWPEGWKSPIIFEGKILWDISLTALSYFKELIDTWKKDSCFYFFLFGISFSLT